MNVESNSARRHQVFKRYWGLWCLVNHFLPGEYVLELLGAIMENIAPDLPLRAVVAEATRVPEDDLTVWLTVAPSSDSELVGYFQSLLYRLASQSEARAYVPQFKDAPELQKRISGIERYITNAPNTFKKPADERRIDEESGAALLFNTITAADKTIATGDRFSIEAMEIVLGSIDSALLRLIVFKHIGDLAILTDNLDAAKTLYDLVATGTAELWRHENATWGPLITHLGACTTESRAFVLATLGHTEVSAKFLTDALDAAPLSAFPAFHSNAAQDADVLRRRVALTQNKLVTRESRLVEMRPRLLQSSLRINQSMDRLFVLRKYEEAASTLNGILRREIALGMHLDASKTKGYLALARLAAATENRLSTIEIEEILQALKQLLESEWEEFVGVVDWDRLSKTAKISSDHINDLQDHVSRHAGSASGRGRVFVSLLRQWVPRLPRASESIALSMLGALAEIAESGEVSSNSEKNVAVDALEAMLEILDLQPSFKTLMSSRLASVIVVRLPQKIWWTGIEKIVALAYAICDELSELEHETVTAAIVSLLEEISPENQVWVIVRPLLNFLGKSAELGRFSKASPLTANVALQIVRLASEQTGENAWLLANLEFFGKVNLPVEIKNDVLPAVIERVKRDAAHVGSSSAPYNIYALTRSLELSGRDGLEAALAATVALIANAVAARGSGSLMQLDSAIRVIATELSSMPQKIGVPEYELAKEIEPLWLEILKLWEAAKDKPRVFASFSLFREGQANRAIVHNWAFACIQLGLALGKEREIRERLLSALECDDLREGISLALANSALSLQNVRTFQVPEVDQDDEQSFYTALGARLAIQVSMNQKLAAKLCAALLQGCLRHGPRAPDTSVLMAAKMYSIELGPLQADLMSYGQRVEANSELRTMLQPLLTALTAPTTAH